MCCCLLIRYQENCHSHFASPKGAAGQVHTLSVAIFPTTDTFAIEKA